MQSHMVFDPKMQPIHCNNPEAVKRWLTQRITRDPEALRYWVRVWKNGRYVHFSAAEYLSASSDV